MSLERDPASRAPWPFPAARIERLQREDQFAEKHDLDPLAGAVRKAAHPGPVQMLGPEPQDETQALRARLDDALQALRMVDDNNRVDEREKRKAWRHSFVAAEVRRVLAGNGYA